MKSKDISLQSLVVYGVVIAGAITMLVPFYLMFVYSTHTNAEILSIPPPLWFGDAFFENVKILLERLPDFWHNVWLSFYVACITTVANLFFCSLAGFAFAMYRFRFKEALFGMMLATIMVPTFINMIPTTLIMTAIGWMNSAKALIIPSACSAIGIFLMRQYIGSAVPYELVEAARMDGCGEFKIYYRVILPLIGPALGTLGLITFIGSWNNFVGPLVVMRDMRMYTVPLALRALQGTGNTPWGAIFAGTSIAVVPLLVIFIFYSRRLIEGLTAGAVKG